MDNLANMPMDDGFDTDEETIEEFDELIECAK